jgi:hypothetical protein
MTFSLGQSLLKLPEDSACGATFLFEKPQAVPKTDNLSLSRGVHLRFTQYRLECERKENKPQAARIWGCRREDY